MKTISSGNRLSFNIAVSAMNSSAATEMTDEFPALKAGELYRINSCQIEYDVLSKAPVLDDEATEGSLVVGLSGRVISAPNLADVYGTDMMCVAGYVINGEGNMQANFFRPFMFYNYCRKIFCFSVNFYIDSAIVIRYFIDFDVVAPNASELPALMLSC